MLSWTQFLDILKLPELQSFPMTCISGTVCAFLKICSWAVHDSFDEVPNGHSTISKQRTARTVGELQTLKFTHRWGWMQGPSARHEGDASCLQSALGAYTIKMCWLNKVGKQRLCIQTGCETSSTEPCSHCKSAFSVHMFLRNVFHPAQLEKNDHLGVPGFDNHKDCVWAFAPVMCIQAKIKSPSVQCEWKHYWAYLGKLSKLSLPDYVQFHLQPPRGGVWELELSHSLWPTHLHINSHTQTPLLAMTHLVYFYFCGFPCLIREPELVSWQKYI